MQLRSAGLVAGLVALSLIAAASAAAAPVTVNLRIEGADRTLFEDPVTVDVRPFRFTGDATGHTCDGTAGNQGPSAAPVARPAAPRSPRRPSARRSRSPARGPTRSAARRSHEIAGASVAFDPGTNRFLAEYQNGQFASRGSCGDPVQNGDDVLFAYADGSETLLKLTGPATRPARPGRRRRRSPTPAPALPWPAPPSASATSGADGTVAVGPFAERGGHDLKATKAGAIRSNRLRVCVTDGADGALRDHRAGRAGPGAAGRHDPGPPAGRISAIREQQRFARASRRRARCRARSRPIPTGSPR